MLKSNNVGSLIVLLVVIISASAVFAQSEVVQPVSSLDISQDQAEEIIRKERGYEKPHCVNEEDYWSCKPGPKAKRGDISKEEVEKAGLDWEIISRKLIENGWAERMAATTLLRRSLDFGKDEPRMLEVFGDDAGKVLPILKKMRQLDYAVRINVDKRTGKIVGGMHFE